MAKRKRQGAEEQARTVWFHLAVLDPSSARHHAFEKLREETAHLVGARSSKRARAARPIVRAILEAFQLVDELRHHGYHGNPETPEAKSFISERIRAHYPKKPLRQAVAIALEEARARGFRVPERKDG